MALPSIRVVMCIFVACAAAARGQGAFEKGPVFYGDPGSWFGSAVAGPGDVNQDGHPDILVGGRSGAGGLGMARVLSGKDGVVLHTFFGDSAGDAFGDAVSGAGDVDHDGFADVVVGAYGDDDFGAQCGSARVLSGKTGAAIFTFYGGAADDLLGIDVSGDGDVDNDGFPDITVGASGEGGAGAVRVFSGATGALLYAFPGVAANDGFGYKVDGAHDLNGDGFADVAASAPWNDDIGTSHGHVRVFSGANGGVLYTLHSQAGLLVFGDDMAATGDIDADGFDDLIVGLPYYDRAFVYSGIDGSLRFALSGNPPQFPYATDKFGVAVNDAGDVDGDGHDDLIVGALDDDDNGAESGTAFVFSGATGAVLGTIAGDLPGDHFGLGVAPLGDVDLDGAPDFVIGAREADDPNGVQTGSARVIYGPGSSVTSYGVGCAGAGGIVPTLESPPGLWLVGHQVEIAIDHGLGGATALLLFGQQPASTPILGCTLLVTPVSPAVLAFPLLGSGPGNGARILLGFLPASVAGLTFTTQAFVLDAGAAAGVSATNGLEVEIH